MPENPLSLHALNTLLRDKLSEQFSHPYWIIAEIMDLNVNRTGHCYLELIEKSESDDAIIARSRATIWAFKYKMLKPFFETTAGIPLRPGIKIMLKAEVNFHEVYGLSLNISDIDPSYTVGDLAMKKKEIIRRLKAEGVFGMNRELLLPPVPQRIAVISSETAAGYGDFTDTLINNRYAFRFKSDLFPAVMQGDAAEASIISALEMIHAREQAYDAVVLIRGGGSQADLECFNSYHLSLHIAQFPLPVLTGIGHDRDETIADLVAHLSLKTPTAVAEFLVDRLLEFSSFLEDTREQLSRLTREGLKEASEGLVRYSGKIKYLWGSYLSHATQRLQMHETSVGKFSHNLLNRQQEKLNGLEKHIDLLKPERVLARGYSITTCEGQLLKSVSDLPSSNASLTTQLSDGILESQLTGVSKKKP